MEWIKEYQELIVAFGLSLMSGVALVWKLFWTPINEKIEKNDQRLQNHEDRLRELERDYPTHDDLHSIERRVESLEKKLDDKIGELSRQMGEAISASCAHNNETRERLHQTIMNTQDNITRRIDTLISAMAAQGGNH